MPTYEMLWDCQYCGTDKNLGLTHRFCPNCGAPQNPNARYYPSDDEKIEVKDHKFVGADVTCPNCGTLNSGAVEFCGNCGAPQTDAAEAKLLDPEYRAAHDRFESSGSRDVTKERFDAEMQRVGVQKPEKAKNGAGLNPVIIVGVVLALIVAGAVFAFTRTEETRVVVVDHLWERSVDVQEFQSFRADSWRDSRPSGVNVSIVPGSCERQQRDTRRVPDGETCRTVRQDNGDGTFSERQECTTNYREEPIYDDMCRWTGQRWENITLQGSEVSGNLSAAPFFPNLELECEGQQIIGCQRITGQNERYLVIFRGTESDSVYRCAFPQDEWENFPLESVWDAEIRSVGDSLICDSLER